MLARQGSNQQPPGQRGLQQQRPETQLYPGSQALEGRDTQELPLSSQMSACRRQAALQYPQTLGLLPTSQLSTCRLWQAGQAAWQGITGSYPSGCLRQTAHGSGLAQMRWQAWLIFR